jgi:DNA-binding transcriptional regulator YdaS (Cro superfamily)
MYDYKLYVSLLIFVYSLMDSDERASLQKKMFWMSNRSLCMLRKWWMMSFYMYRLCMFQYMLQWTCLVCACYITCCDVKKKLEMSIEYLQRATFTIKKEVGGRELTKLWVYSLVLPSQLRFPPNVFFPNFVRGEWSKVWIDVQWWGVHPSCFSKWQKKVKHVNAWTWNMFNRFPHSALREKVRWSHLHSVMSNKQTKKKQCEHLCIMATSLVAAYEMFEQIAMYICLLYV